MGYRLLALPSAVPRRAVLALLEVLVFVVLNDATLIIPDHDEVERPDMLVSKVARLLLDRKCPLGHRLQCS